MAVKESNKEEVEVIDMDELLGTKASVTIASSEDEKKTVFDRGHIDTSFIDNPPVEETEEEKASKLEKRKEMTQEEKDLYDKEHEEIEKKRVLDEAGGDLGAIEDEYEDEGLDNSDESKKSTPGRKKALTEAMTKLVNKGVITLFSDQPDIETYTIDDYEELIETNIASKINETAKNAPLEIFNKLDPKLQSVIAYSLDGGKDIVSVLKTVTRSQEVAELSLENEDDQERIVREHLRSIDYGDNESIEDEIASIIDRGELEKKATTFKPKLDEKQAKILKQKLDDQELKTKQAKEASEKYSDTIFKVLDNPTLNGIPLNGRDQTMLYYGLTDSTQYEDRNGNPTTALGHLIEKYQFGEDANPSILAEALLLMSDPDEYRDRIISIGKQKQDSKTVRKLKTAEGNRNISSSKGDGSKAPAGRRVVKRTTKPRSIFGR